MEGYDDCKDANPKYTYWQLTSLADLLATCPESDRLEVVQTVTRTGGRHTYAMITTASGKSRGVFHVSKRGHIRELDQGEVAIP